MGGARGRLEANREQLVYEIALRNNCILGLNVFFFFFFFARLSKEDIVTESRKVSS